MRIGLLPLDLEIFGCEESYLRDSRPQGVCSGPVKQGAQVLRAVQQACACPRSSQTVPAP